MVDSEGLKRANRLRRKFRIKPNSIVGRVGLSSRSAPSGDSFLWLRSLCAGPLVTLSFTPVALGLKSPARALHGLATSLPNVGLRINDIPETFHPLSSARSFSVSRYFYRRLLGLSGSVYSISPYVSISRTRL
jgi:hypothetical protein